MRFFKPVPIITKALVSVALCVGTAPAYANTACQGTDCVFPVTDGPPPVAETAVLVEEERGGLGLLPILLGLGALAAILWLLLDDDDDEEEPLPISP